MWLSDTSVKRPVMAIVLSLLLCVFGIVSFTQLSVREMPDVESPVVSITTSYSGASLKVENGATYALDFDGASPYFIAQVKGKPRNFKACSTSFCLQCIL